MTRTRDLSAQGDAATTGEMQAGTETALKGMSPANVSEAITALGGPSSSYDTRTSNTILAAGDNGGIIEITGASTFTQTFTAAATLGATWSCVYKNSGTGDVTVDPNASETISGLTSFIMYPGEARLIQCDGTNFHTIVLNTFIKKFLSGGTFTKPPGYQHFDVDVLGAGGGGGGGAKQASWRGGGGGAGGMMAKQRLLSSAISASVTVTIGAGGAFGPDSDTLNGSAGGDTTFGAYIIAFGGEGGPHGASGAFADHAYGGSITQENGGISTGYIAGNLSTLGQSYGYNAGGTLWKITVANNNPPQAGIGGLHSGATGGCGQIPSYAGSAGGVSGDINQLSGGGAAGAVAGAGAGTNGGADVMEGGGGGSDGVGGDGGLGSGGGGGGRGTTTIGYNGGTGGDGAVTVFGVL